MELLKIAESKVLGWLYKLVSKIYQSGDYKLILKKYCCDDKKGKGTKIVTSTKRLI